MDKAVKDGGNTAYRSSRQRGDRPMLVRRPGQKTNTYICPQLESSMGQPPTIAQDYRY